MVGNDEVVGSIPISSFSKNIDSIRVSEVFTSVFYCLKSAENTHLTNI